MRLIALDTNAYSALQKGNKVVAELCISATEIGLPITVLGELYYGIFDGSNGPENNANLRKFLSTGRVTVLQINELTASVFGEISTELKKNGRPMQQNDIWIAALCKQYGFSLISNDHAFSNVVGLDHITFG